MNERTAHRDRWRDDLAAYALDGLGERETSVVARHVSECYACAEHLHWLAPAVNMLPASVAQQEPPPELRMRLMDAVQSEAAPEDAAAPAAARPRAWLDRLGFSGWSLRPALAGFAVFLLIAAGVAGYAVRDGGAPEAQTYAAKATGGGSLASGTLEVSGDEGSLRVSNLPVTNSDEVYQAWVQHIGPDGRITPSSVFVVHDDGSGEVAIPDGLDGAAKVMVTREPAGGSAKPTEGALLIADIT